MLLGPMDEHQVDGGGQAPVDTWQERRNCCQYLKYLTKSPPVKSDGQVFFTSKDILSPTPKVSKRGGGI